MYLTKQLNLCIIAVYHELMNASNREKKDSTQLCFISCGNFYPDIMIALPRIMLALPKRKTQNNKHHTLYYLVTFMKRNISEYFYRFLPGLQKKKKIPPLLG